VASITKGRNPRSAYTVRYREPSGKQRERSFRTRREAADFKASVEHSTRDQTYADPRLGKIPFREYAAQVLAGMDLAEGTRLNYRTTLNRWLVAWAGTRTLADVCADREGATLLLNESMADLSGTYRRNARALMTAVANEAVNAGRISNHRLAGIRITRPREAAERIDFVFPSHEQLSALADSLNGYGLVVWLMRGCGLRIREALAVEREDFIDDGQTLRVSAQASVDGSKRVPLKHRKSLRDYRDVPVPGYLWEMVKDRPSGPFLPGRNGRPYLGVSAVGKRFAVRIRELGIGEGFSPHSLRHAFASALLGAGVPITDVAAWLGHQSIGVTYAVYGHLLESAAARGREALDEEYAAWSASE
jgi:integrase